MTRAHPEVREDLHGLCLGLAAPQHGGGQLGGQVAQLVAHEGNQGGHHQRGALLHQGRHLVAEALPRTCHHRPWFPGAALESPGASAP